MVVVDDLAAIQGALGDMTDEEREEFVVMSQALALRRNRLRRPAMADGDAPHTYLSYVECPDGITRKMDPDTADEYVKLNEGAKIVRRGEMEKPDETEIIGATKAKVGAMFDDDGKQIDSVGPMTTRTYHASDAANTNITTPHTGSPVDTTKPPSDASQQSARPAAARPASGSGSGSGKPPA